MFNRNEIGPAAGRITRETDGLLAVLLIAAFLLTFAIVELSVYLRARGDGFGCAAQPYCYGDLSKPEISDVTASRHALQKVHRGAASLLVLAAMLIAYRVFHSRKPSAAVRNSVILVIVLLAVLSIIGPYTPQKQYPVFATANSVGGMLLLATVAGIWWRAVSLRQRVAVGRSSLRDWALLSLFLAIGTVASGAWSSANYTGLAATVETDKPVFTLLLESFNPLRELVLDSSHRVLADAAMPWIQAVHRLFALVLALSVVPLCMLVLYLRPALWATASAVLGLIILEFFLGWLAPVANMSLLLIMAHHLIAVLLVLALLKLVLLLGIRKLEHAS